MPDADLRPSAWEALSGVMTMVAVVIVVLAAQSAMAQPTIVAPADFLQQPAGKDLLSYIGRMTATQPRVATWAGTGQPPAVAAPTIIVASAQAQALPAAVRREMAKAKSDQACAVWPDEQRVWLVGKGARGMAHAVYQYLYSLGCRWYFPGKLGENVPKVPPPKLTTVKPYFHEPQIIYRSMWLAYGGRPAWQRTEYADFARRNHQGGVAMSMGHNLYRIIPPAKYGKTHPEYFPLIGGARFVPPPTQTHNWQPCTSNPDVIRIAVEAARKYFDQRPDAWSFSLSPNDGYGWCQCEKCQALDPPEYRNQPNRGKGRRMLIFANAVARELAKTHPGKRVCFYAYAGSVEPPDDVKAEPNVDVALAHYGWCACYVHPITDPDCRNNTEFRKLVAGWRKVAHSLIAREYFTGLMPPTDMLVTVATGYTLLDNIPYYARNGFIGINSESIPNMGAAMLNYYVASRLMWDPSQDGQALLNDFYSGCFGPAASAVRHFHEAIVRAAQEARRSRSPYLSDELMTKLDVILKQAEAAATSLPYRERVAMIRDAYDYTRLMREMIKTGSIQAAEKLNELAARCEREHSWAVDPVVHRHRVNRVPGAPSLSFKLGSARRFSNDPIPDEAYKVGMIVRGVHYFIWLPGDERSFTVRDIRLGKYLDQVTVALYSKDGKRLARAVAKIQKPATVDLPEGAGGPLIIAVNSGANAAAVDAKGPLVLFGQSFHFLGATGWLYVLPEDGAEAVSIAVRTEAPGETAKIELRRPDGTLAASADTVEAGAAHVTAEIRADEQDKPWSFRITKAPRGTCEDVYINLGPHLHPVIATHPTRLIIVKVE